MDMVLLIFLTYIHTINIIYISIYLFILLLIILFIYKYNGGLKEGRKWKEHINQKREKEIKLMDLEREWVQNQEEMLLKEGDKRVEENCQHKAPSWGGLFLNKSCIKEHCNEKKI